MLCRILTVVVSLVLAGCGPPAQPYSPDDDPIGSYYDSERANAQGRHDRRVEDKGVFEGLYLNEAAINEYCGAPDEKGRWDPSCYRRLHHIYWRRLQLHYQGVDWQQVVLVCDAYPEKCANPRELEFVVRVYKGKASQLELNTDLDKIDAGERQARQLEDERQEAARQERLRLVRQVQDIFEFGDKDCIIQGSSHSHTTSSGFGTMTDASGQSSIKCRREPRP